MTQYGPVPEFPVKGKIVAITGGGSGIGLALVKLCHSQGARVLIGDLKLTKEAEEYMSQSSGNDVAFETCDVSSWKSLHELISASVTKFGEVPDVVSTAEYMIFRCLRDLLTTCSPLSSTYLVPAFSSRDGRTFGYLTLPERTQMTRC